MDVVDYLLDGLEAALELERELGVRLVEVDRGLLGADHAERPRGVRAAGVPGAVSGTAAKAPAPAPAVVPSSDLVFLHDRPLSPKGVEMMAKIVAALHRTAENAPIVVVPPVPKGAKVIVVLGGRALKAYFPRMKGEPGQWNRLPTGEDVLITYSPEYILRFGSTNPASQKALKQNMWTSLKAVVQRLKG